MDTFIKSSSSFHDKIELPPHYREDLNEECEGVIRDYLEVRRRRTSLFSFNGQAKKKLCVLIPSGRLLIYSSYDRGLSINLDLLSTLRIQVSANGVLGKEDSAVRCVVHLYRGKEHVTLKMRGERLAARWCKTMADASHGLSPKGMPDSVPRQGLTWLWRARVLSSTTPNYTNFDSHNLYQSQYEECDNNSSIVIPSIGDSSNVAEVSIPLDFTRASCPSSTLHTTFHSAASTGNDSSLYRSTVSRRENSLPQLKADSILLASSRAINENEKVGQQRKESESQA